ncbi:MAG: glucokinase [Pseudomonadota bacterium]
MKDSSQMLVADVGGTHTRCGICLSDAPPDQVVTFKNADFVNLADCIGQYLSNNGFSPTQAGIGVAGPVLGDEISFSNSSWHFSCTELQRDLDLDRLEVINDFTALAYALPNLPGSELIQVGEGREKDQGAKGVLGPGTGLGVSGLIQCEFGWTAITGEGGHVDLAATTAEEAEVVKVLIQKHGHCSAERVLSGEGLVNLYRTREEILGRQPSPIKPSQITSGALDNKSEFIEVMNLFFAFLGSAAGNLALTLGAHGGVYVGGGIVPRCIDLIEDSPFRKKFEAKGRFRDYLRNIPTYVITSETPALAGLQAYLNQSQGKT